MQRYYNMSQRANGHKIHICWVTHNIYYLGLSVYYTIV